MANAIIIVVLLVIAIFAVRGTRREFLLWRWLRRASGRGEEVRKSGDRKDDGSYQGNVLPALCKSCDGGDQQD